MNRRHFLRSLGLGLAALTLRLRPESLPACTEYRSFATFDAALAAKIDTCTDRLTLDRIHELCRAALARPPIPPTRADIAWAHGQIARRGQR